MRRILTALALVGMFAVAALPGEASAAQTRTTSRPRATAHRSITDRSATHRMATHRTVTHRTAATPHTTTHARAGAPSRVGTQSRVHAKAHVRSSSQARTNTNHRHVAYRTGGGFLSRTLGTRLYYSNAFRGMIPGTGYGGFRRPAFGNRGY